MAGFWTNFREKNTEQILHKSGYYELPDDLRKKFKLSEKKEMGNEISNYFSWEEFCEVFTKTTYLFNFSYKNKECSLMNAGGYADIWSEMEGVTETYETPQLLLENARVDGKSLQDMWNDLILT